MIEKPDDVKTIGLYLENENLAIAKLSLVKNTVQIDQLTKTSIKSDVNPLYKDKDLQKTLTIASIPTQDVLIRQLEIKLKKEKDIPEVLSFQAEPLIPYPLENAIIDSFILHPTEEGHNLTLLVAKKDHLFKVLEQFHSLQIEPEVIVSEANSLAAFTHYFLQEDDKEESLCSVFLGETKSFCIILQEGRLIAAKATSHGTHELQETISFETLKKEIKRLILSLAKQGNTSNIKNIVFAGAGAHIPHLKEEITQELELREVFYKKEVKDDILDFTLPIGSALCGLPFTKDRINFRQKEFTYPYPWKRLLPSLATFAGLSVLLGLLFYLFTLSYASYQLKSVKNDYLDLLEAIHLSYEDFERSFEKKPTGDFTQLQDLSKQDLLARIAVIGQKIQSNPENFPLLPNVPKTSDILAWLSAHHMGLKSASDTFPLQVESFNYTLVKRPELNKKQEKYQVKVELEFSTDTPKLAREFHDTLIEPNDFIDPKSEIKWNANKGLYKTSFYLKDKTFYP